jgi:hypothetical protein
MQGSEDSRARDRIQELELLIEEKRREEADARDRAAKASAQLGGMAREVGSSIHPEKASKLWQVTALILLKGSLQAANDIRRESAEKALRDAEATEEQARTDRRALEVKLNEERRASTEGT